MTKRSKTKSGRPAFADGSYFHDIPMLEVDETGNWQVIEEYDGGYSGIPAISSTILSENDEYTI
jgi:hypothetical protein